MSDQHIRLLRQATKAARTRLTAFLEHGPAADTADDEVTQAREASALRGRVSSAETRLHEAEQRRDGSRPPR